MIWRITYVAAILAARALMRDSGAPYAEFATELGLGMGIVLLWIFVARSKDDEGANESTVFLSRRSVALVALALFVGSSFEYYLLPMPKIQEMPLPMVAGAYALAWVSPLLVGTLIWGRTQ